MFSQLCRARPRLLHKRSGKPVSEKTAENDLDRERQDQQNQCTSYRHSTGSLLEAPSNDLCKECQGNTNLDINITDNPAYGLSSEKWLNIEVQDVLESPTNDTLIMEKSRQQCRDDKSTHSLPTLKPDTPTSQQSKSCDSYSGADGRLTAAESRMKEIQISEKNKMDRAGGNTVSLHSQSRSAIKQGDASKTCDSKATNVIEGASAQEKHLKPNHEDNNLDSGIAIKPKKHLRERTLALSLMKPLAKPGEKKPENHSNVIERSGVARQKPAPQNFKLKYKNAETRDTKTAQQTNDILGMHSNPLLEIAELKPEESIQEWLSRIGDSETGSWTDNSEKKDDGTEEQKRKDSRNLHSNKNNHPSTLPWTSTDNMSRKQVNHQARKPELNTTDILNNASKASPANIPMVVMQCSRLHSHIGFTPPFQQTSIPMGTLVTALYQESEWLYVQTPHGVEGFVSASNCAPMGTINKLTQDTRRPWEPCDFPIQIRLRRPDFGQQQGTFISATLPAAVHSKRSVPFVSTVKLKTNFYSDRYIPNHTFKSKESIKTAKTVTDILRSSPETKISNQ